MLAIGSATMSEMLSLRRVHSPAASSASANSAAEQDAHAGTEQPGLDRIADQEEAAERERQAADPDHPAGADALLEAGLGLRRRAAAWRRRDPGRWRRRVERGDFRDRLRPRSSWAIGGGCSAASGGALLGRLLRG